MWKHVAECPTFDAANLECPTCGSMSLRTLGTINVAFAPVARRLPVPFRVAFVTVRVTPSLSPPALAPLAVALGQSIDAHTQQWPHLRTKFPPSLLLAKDLYLLTSRWVALKLGKRGQAYRAA